MVTESFWIIPEDASVRTPASIFREQAKALTERTKGILVGEVETEREHDGRLAIKLTIIAPALDNYRYRLLSYSQPIELYPGHLWNGLENHKIEDEAEFVTHVREELSSQKTKHIVTSLLAQSRDAA